MAQTIIFDLGFNGLGNELGCCSSWMYISINSSFVFGDLGVKPQRSDLALASEIRGKGLHARNRHLRNHHGVSVAFSRGISVACSARESDLTLAFEIERERPR